MSRKKVGITKYFHDYKIILKVLKIISQAFAVWPLSLNASKLRHFLYISLRWIYILNCAALLLSLVAGFQCCYWKIKDTMKSIVEGMFSTEQIFNLLYLQAKKTKFQTLLSEMERFVQITKPYEKILMKRHLKRVEIVFLLPPIFVVGSLLFIISPLVSSQRVIPLNTVYFAIPIEQEWGLYVAYGLNIFSVLEVAGTVTVDFIVLAILWHSTLKFDLVRYTPTRQGLGKFVRKHQEALKHAENIKEIIVPLVVKLIAAVTIDVITCGILILHNVPLYELTQFFLVTIYSILRLLACCWCAEIMAQTAFDIGSKFYNAPWINASPKVRKIGLMIIRRSQKRIALGASGIVSDLSLRFYFSLLYSTLSVFTTLRAILQL